jgi:ABC-type transporter Mla maintaining outer membrane lipid asymmetry permease subunit MlaE
VSSFDLEWSAHHPGRAGGVRGLYGMPPGFHLHRFRNAVITRAFVKSMKKAPTIGTTR